MAKESPSDFQKISKRKLDEVSEKNIDEIDGYEFLIKKSKKLMNKLFYKEKPGMAGRIAAALGYVDLAEKVIQEYFDKKTSETMDYEDIYKISTILVETDPKFVRQLMEKFFKEENFGLAGRMALLLKDFSLAKESLTKCLDQKSMIPASEIAVGLVEKEPDLAEKIMKKCINEEKLVLAANIAVALAKKKSESVQKLMEICLKKKKFDLCAKIAIALDDIELTKKMIEKLLKEGMRGFVSEFVAEIAKKEPEFAREIIEKFSVEKKPYLVGKIAAELGDSELAKKTFHECLEMNWFEAALDIAIRLINNNKFDVIKKELIQEFFKEGKERYATEIVLFLLDKQKKKIKQK